MVKHTQTIRQQFAEELFECVWPFCGVGAFYENSNRRWKVLRKYLLKGSSFFNYFQKIMFMMS